MRAQAKIIELSRLRPFSTASCFGPRLSNSLKSCSLGGALVPLPVAPEQFQQLLDRPGLVALAHQRQRQVVARLVVVGVALDRRRQLRGLADLGAGLGQLDLRPRRRERRVAFLALRRQRQYFARAVDLAERQVRARQPGQRRDVALVLGQDRREGLRRIGGRALGQHLLGRSQRLLEPVVAARHRDQPVDEGLDLRRRLRAQEPVHRLPADEAEDRRDRLHPHLRRDPLVLVDVDLDQPHLALGLGHRLLQRRGQRLARPAPRRPEIDDHRHLVRGLDHVGHEGRLGGVLDRARGRGFQVHRHLSVTQPCALLRPYVG